MQSDIQVTWADKGDRLCSKVQQKQHDSAVIWTFDQLLETLSSELHMEQGKNWPTKGIAISAKKYSEALSKYIDKYKLYVYEW